MTAPFAIDPVWVGGEHGSDEVRLTTAKLKIIVGDRVATRVDDERSRSVRDEVFVSAYPLALWLATSWWRLIHEPAPKGNRSLGWRMSHEMAAAGQGFLWPPLVFESDGEVVEIAGSHTQISTTAPLGYLEEFRQSVPLKTFEQGIADFFSLVLGRLNVCGLGQTELLMIQEDLTRERSDPAATVYRKLEARLGFDPDEAPEATIERFRTLGQSIGQAATEEIAPTCVGLDPIRILDDLQDWVKVGGVQGTIGASAGLAKEAGDPALRDHAPWARGWTLARSARKAWGLKSGPIPSEGLADILGISPRVLQAGTAAAHPSPLGVAIRNGDHNQLRMFLRKCRPEARRFEVARVLADSVIAPADDRWLPVTDAKTVRQKVQRAFAAEFLCPIEELKEKLQGDFSAESIEDVADEYSVSSLAVESHLANHGLLPRF